MTSEVVALLKQARDLLAHDHTNIQLAADWTGRRVPPLSPDAVAWSTIGALCKLAPSGLPSPAPQHTDTAWQAFLLLEDTAAATGYGGDTRLVRVDDAGPAAVAKLFARALNQCDQPQWRQRKPAAGLGGHPRGLRAS